MLAWYVAKTKPRQERALASFLAQWRVQTYTPKVKRPKDPRGAKEHLFPSYVFCLLDPESRTWPIARWAPGMSYLLPRESSPAAVPEAFIAGLRQRVDEWNADDTIPFHSGERVKLSSGTLTDLEGIFQRYIPATERCVVLVRLMGRLVSAEVPRYDIDPPAIPNRKAAETPSH